MQCEALIVQCAPSGQWCAVHPVCRQAVHPAAATTSSLSLHLREGAASRPTAPAGGPTAPAKRFTALAGGTTAPARRSTASAAWSTASEGGSTAPAGWLKAPAGKPTAPAAPSASCPATLPSNLSGHISCRATTVGLHTG